jgi:hypothetical protein
MQNAVLLIVKAGGTYIVATGFLRGNIKQTPVEM